MKSLKASLEKQNLWKMIHSLPCLVHKVIQFPLNRESTKWQSSGIRCLTIETVHCKCSHSTGTHSSMEIFQ